MGPWVELWVVSGFALGELVLWHDGRGSNDLTAGVYAAVVALGPLLIAVALCYRLATGRWPGK